MVTRQLPVPSGRAGAAPAIGAVLALAAAAFVVAGSLLGSQRRRYQLERVRAYPDSAPPEARRSVADRRAVSGNAVRINRPRQELYDVWRDFANLPGFMENVRGGTAARRRPLRLDDRGAGGRQRHPAHRDHRGAPRRD